MPQELTTPLLKLAKLSPVVTMAMAGVLFYNGYITRSAVNAQTVAQSQAEITELHKRVGELEQHIAEQDVLASEIKNLQQSIIKTDGSINRLADELHNWQREERRVHGH